MTITKILVAIDRSAQADQVFEQALLLAKQNQAELLVFHCLNFDAAVWDEQERALGTRIRDGLLVQQKWWEEQIEELEAVLAGYIQRGEAAGVKVFSDYKVGDPGRWIWEMAERWQVDLIVMGRRGRSGLMEVVLGSVSSYVIHHAPCSVFVVQERSNQSLND